MRWDTARAVSWASMGGAEDSGATAESLAEDPADALADLAHGLARVARRRRAMGMRHIAAPPEVQAMATAARAAAGAKPELAAFQAPAPQAPTPKSPAARLQAPPTTATPKPDAPEPLPAPRGVTSRSPAVPERVTAASRAAPGSPRTPAEVRSLAASCPDLASLAEAVAACRACPLGASRTRSVFQDGQGAERVLFVGEAPGFHEDQRGVPFVGDAGQLLTDIITKGMGLDRARDVVICNVLKCRPPDNRDPAPAEKALCTGWLDRQIELVDPRLVIALGRHAAGHLLATDAPLGRLRGRVHERGGRPVVVTYHPAYLLRNPADKKACWQDIQLALQVLGRPLPGRGGGA